MNRADQPLDWEEGTAGSHLDPEVCVAARAAKCPACGSRLFTIFVIKGQNHAHLECVNCGVSYCMGGRRE